jgi:hypothetical protein
MITGAGFNLQIVKHAILILIVVCLASTAGAQTDPSPGYLGYTTGATSIGYSSVDKARKALQSDANARIRTREGWTLVDVRSGSNEGFWSFPPKSHPAYPSVVRRRAAEQNGRVKLRMGVSCGASKPACDHLVREFNELNETMARDLEGKKRGTSPAR